MLDQGLKYRVKPYQIYSDAESVDYNDSISNRDIEDIFRMPKLGKAITFGEAFRLRLEMASNFSLYKKPFIGDFSMSLPQWANLNGYHILYNEEEIEMIEGAAA